VHVERAHVLRGAHQGGFDRTGLGAVEPADLHVLHRRERRVPKPRPAARQQRKRERQHQQRDAQAPPGRDEAERSPRDADDR
jgi:hypothetical protein